MRLASPPIKSGVGALCAPGEGGPRIDGLVPPHPSPLPDGEREQAERAASAYVKLVGIPSRFVICRILNRRHSPTALVGMGHVCNQAATAAAPKVKSSDAIPRISIVATRLPASEMMG